MITPRKTKQNKKTVQNKQKKTPIKQINKKKSPKDRRRSKQVFEFLL